MQIAESINVTKKFRRVFLGKKSYQSNLTSNEKISPKAILGNVFFVASKSFNESVSI